MTNVCTLPSLRLLDLGYNSIRHITGVQSLSHLQKLFLGRNKIETISVFSFTKRFIQGLEGLHLHILDLQSNRIRSSRGLETLVDLEELYL